MKKKIFLFLMLNSIILADTFSNQYPEFIVGFGKGGSTDRMTRTMVPFLEKELKTKIDIKNIKEKATLVASNYVLDRPINSGYTVLSSSLSPYLLNTILSKKAKYSLDDFAIINLQWFDFEFIAVNKTSKFNTLVDILEYIKKYPKTLNIGIMNKSSGNISFNLLLEKFDIARDAANITFFQGGKKARLALVDSKIDVLIISAQGSEKYREDIKPITVLSSKRSKRWDAPTINESLKGTGIEMPIINGSIRGFAVSKKFKTQYPMEFKKLERVVKKILAKRKVQQTLKNKNIGYTWLGSEKSTKILEESYEMFKKYDYLLN